MRLRLRSVLVALIAFVAVGGLITALDSGRKAQDAADGADGGSVQLVVDFGASSELRTIDVRVPNFAGSGWQLLEQAGVEVEGTADYPKSFVCRLDGWPTRQMESCDSAPSVRNGHWAYWVTNPALSDGWVLSGVGAAAYVAQCGQAEAWVWVPPGLDSAKVRPRVAAQTFECKK